jgi:hypothetical protein
MGTPVPAGQVLVSGLVHMTAPWAVENVEGGHSGLRPNAPVDMHRPFGQYRPTPAVMHKDPVKLVGICPGPHKNASLTQLRKQPVGETQPGGDTDPGAHSSQGERRELRLRKNPGRQGGTMQEDRVRGSEINPGGHCWQSAKEPLFHDVVLQL